jgi:hypothetical protein
LAPQGAQVPEVVASIAGAQSGLEGGIDVPPRSPAG